MSSAVFVETYFTGERQGQRHDLWPCLGQLNAGGVDLLLAERQVTFGFLRFCFSCFVDRDLGGCAVLGVRLLCIGRRRGAGGQQ
ncbi:hypothetical protein D3C76_1676080 [compost metagenome]